MEKYQGYKSLLKWSLKQTDETREATPLAEDKRQWLSEALEGVVVDESEKMKNIIRICVEYIQSEKLPPPVELPKVGLDGPPPPLDLVQKAVESLVESMDDIDRAKNFSLMGGLPVLTALSQSRHPDIAAGSCEALAYICQNNPDPQKWAMEIGTLKILFRVFLHDRDDRVKAKSLLAISAMLRNNEEGQTFFRENDGFGLLATVLDGRFSLTLKRKSLFLCRHLFFGSFENRKAALKTRGLLQAITSFVSDEFDADFRENAVGCLIEATMDCREVSDFLKRDRFITHTLVARLVALNRIKGEERENFVQEMDMLKELLTTLKAKNESS